MHHYIWRGGCSGIVSVFFQEDAETRAKICTPSWWMGVGVTKRCLQVYVWNVQMSQNQAQLLTTLRSFLRSSLGIGLAQGTQTTLKSRITPRMVGNPSTSYRNLWTQAGRIWEMNVSIFTVVALFLKMTLTLKKIVDLPVFQECADLP